MTSSTVLLHNDVHHGDSGMDMVAALTSVEVLQNEPTVKRRRCVMTLQQKLEIIERIKKGEKVTQLALEYGIGKATVSDLKRQEEKISAFVSKLQANSSDSPDHDSSQLRRTMRRPRDERVERALHLWLKRERRKGTHVTGPLLMEKAKLFHRELYGEGSSDKFKASTGWLHRFKLRNGIRRQKPPKRKVSEAAVEIDSSEAVDRHLSDLRTLVRDNCLGPEQIYAVTRTRLQWRALPGDSGLLRPSSSDCVMVIGCMNAAGSHKIRLAVVGHPKIRWTAGPNVERMPFRYDVCEGGWLDSDTFVQWFHDEFVVSIRSYYAGSGLAPRALLLVDEGQLEAGTSAATSVQSEDGSIRCVAVPAAISFVTQPVNQFLSSSVKRSYRKELIARAMAIHPCRRLPARLSDLGRRITIKDAGYMLSEAWSAISCDAVRNLWQDILYCLGVVNEQPVLANGALRKASIDDNAGAYFLCEQIAAGPENSYDFVGALRDSYGDVIEANVINWLSADAEDAARSRTPISDLEIIESVRCELDSADSDSEDGDGVQESSECGGRAGGVSDRSGPPILPPSDTEAYACFTRCLAWLEIQPDCEAAQLQLLWRLQNKAAQRRKRKL